MCGECIKEEEEEEEEGEGLEDDEEGECCILSVRGACVR